MGKRIATITTIVMLWSSTAGAAVPGWTEQHPETAPTARYGAAMTYDPHHGYLMFGGRRSDSGRPTSLLPNLEVWDGEQWAGVPLCDTCLIPPRRYGAQLAYDPDHDQTVLYGGTGPARPIIDTWTLQDSTWDRHRAVGNGYCGRLAYDPAHHQLLLLSSGMWKWNGKRWRPLDAVPPVDGCNGNLAYDGTRLILFDAGVTYEWTGKKWVELHPTQSPPARDRAVMAQTASGLVLFGGNDLDGVPLGDTWTWDGTNWTPATSGPSARGAAAGASDGTQVVMFGGSGTPEFMNDTWTWE